ncbi:glycoside hydrolase family 20 zincin-like fold domain-containing protein [Maribacter sp. 2307ULW6-5]|uniref:glycoside hydrolase family 20 zincin-like fold domain-containing protein n=1 Tax=Maribacter sp. 2307ULW6-5 TaxID=3386275 RepID=UPI0039BD4426
MKTFLSFLACSLLLFSCAPKNERKGVFDLLPAAKEFDVQGISALESGSLRYYHLKEGAALPVMGAGLETLEATASEKDADLVLAVDSGLDVPAEGYHLNISNETITIVGKDDAGLFYGLKTLEQLLTDAREQDVNLPLCNIRDYPLLAYRAVHLDVKHHLEKTEYYFDLMDKLAHYKVNAIIVEMEDKLGYVRQPTVASADALSIDTWRELSNYAKERHIEISPLIQGLGHASFILKHPEYENLRDDPESDWAFNPLDPKTYEVQFDLYLDALEATPHGKYLHVGGDEVNTTGRNSGQSALELQLIWLNKVSQFAEKHNRIPIFWDDMPLKQAGVYDPMFRPEMGQREVDSVWAQNEEKLLAFLDQFPKNCIYMRWNYSDPESYGNTKAMEWFRGNGLQVMGATAGQTRWVLMPQEESNMDNIRTFAVNSINSGLNGLLLTLWDDDSPHFELYTRGILAFAENTWAGAQREKSALKAAYRHREFSHALRDASLAFVDELETPVAFWKNALLQGNRRNYLATMEAPLADGVIDLPSTESPGNWSQKHQERLAQAETIKKQTDVISQKIDSMQALAQRNTYALDVYEQVNLMAGFAPQVLLALGELDSAKTPEARQAALEQLSGLKERFATLRNNLETVYAKTRILEKPADYILDQDHHVHLANQSLNFDWQFRAEMLFFEKLDQELLNGAHSKNADPTKK